MHLDAPLDKPREAVAEHRLVSAPISLRPPPNTEAADQMLRMNILIKGGYCAILSAGGED